MDESLAQVVVDLSGRAELVWKAKFKREKIGEMPTELFYHFFKSFADSAGCNLHVNAKGKNEHHKIEAIFKAFARSIKMAIHRDANSNSVPSTKGII
jgi:imidazoleglycerol-phosphate dehydratase/histidinol-phosphatase